MKILIDGHALSSAQKTGKHFYTLSLLRAIATHPQASKHSFHVLVYKKILDLPESFSQLITQKKGLSYYIHMKDIAKKFDLVLSPTSYIPSALIHKNLYTIIYDLAVYQRGFRSNFKAAILEKIILPSVIKNSSHIITISKSIKQQLTLKFPSLSISTILPFSKISPAKKQHSHKNYFLFVGTLEPRKNLVNTIKGYKFFLQNSTEKNPPKLIIVGGKGWQYKKILQTIKAASVEKKVIVRGYVNQKDLIKLYREAIAITYIPHYEGFGLPILEAISQKKSVITSNIPAAIEALGPCGITVDPNNPKQIANAIERIYLDETLRTSLEKNTTNWIKKFSSRSSAEKFYQLLT